MDKLWQWFFVLLVWGFAGYGTGWVYRQRKKLAWLARVGVRTTGVITGHRFTGGDDGSYMAEVVFLTQAGKQQQTETATSHSPQQFLKGTRVAILYDPLKPAYCFVDTYVEREAPTVWLCIIWLVAIGCLGLLVLGIPLAGSAT